MSRFDRRAAGDFTPLVLVPEGQGDEPRMKLSQAAIDYLEHTPNGPNLYTCGSCGGSFVVVHRHHGVTPMFMPCGALRGEGCGGEAKSAFYPRPPLPADVIGLPLWEWYRPSIDEFRTTPDSLREHVEKGGLLIRRRSDALPAELRRRTPSEQRDRLGELFARPS